MAIDRRKVIESLAKIAVVGNDEGLIPSYNVFVNQLPALFWNRFAERLVCRVGPDLKEAAEWLLVNAAHECGYHTGYGIITSEEWKAVVEPMVEKKPEDILHGAFAVFTAWGWAKAEIIELIPGALSPSIRVPQRMQERAMAGILAESSGARAAHRTEQP